MNLHFHTLVLNGVTEASRGALAFQPAPAPSDAEVAAALATIRQRVPRLLVRRGLEPGDAATGPADPLAEESPIMAGIVGASVQGRVALGSRAGARARRLGDARDTAAVTSRGPRQAHLDGFDLHANVWVSAHDRAGAERLCRYVLHPPFAQERLRLRGDGRVALALKRAWHDGTRELVFDVDRRDARFPFHHGHLLGSDCARDVTSETAGRADEHFDADRSVNWEAPGAKLSP